MASIFDRFWPVAAEAKPPESSFLGEAVYCDESVYDSLEPLFPSASNGKNKHNGRNSSRARPVLRRVDFKKGKLPEYEQVDAYAVVIDNAFTLEECDQLLRVAEESSKEGWPVAQVNVGMNRQVLDTSYRRSDRIIYDDQELATKMFNRILPLVEKDIAYLDPALTSSTTGSLHRKSTAAKRRQDKFRVVRMNERLRFLRYQPNGFFKTHIDGAYVTPDHQQSSLYTYHLYLNDNTGPVPLKGGSTRFWQMGASFWSKKSGPEPKYIDVEPVPGRVLLFQHACLAHSGEPITEGIKLTIRSDVMYEKVPDGEVEEELMKHKARNGLFNDEEKAGMDKPEDADAVEN